jgi:uncharacterized protein (TIGR02246 family)
MDDAGGWQRALDVLDIRNLVAQVANVTDTGDPDQYARLFAPDAVWDIPSAPRHGRDDIVQGLLDRRQAGACGPGTNSRHVISNLTVSIDGPDEASGHSYLLFYIDVDAKPSVRAMGRYDDRYVRLDGVWVISRRDITLDTYS